MQEDSLTEPFPDGIGIRGGGKFKQSLFGTSDLPSEDKGRPLGASVHQPLGVGQEAFKLFFRSSEIQRRIIAPLLTDFTSKVDKTFLFSTMNLCVVGVEEIAHKNPCEEFAENADGHVAPPPFVNAKIGPGVIDERPKPMRDSVDGPPGFIDVLDGSGSNGLANLATFNAQIPRQALERLGDGSLGYFKPTEVVEECLNFVGGDGHMVFQPDHGGQGLGPQISAWNFIRGRGGHDVGVARGAPIGVMDEPDNLHPCRNNIFLDMGRRTGCFIQGTLTLGTTVESLINGPIDVRGRRAGAPGVVFLAAPAMGRKAFGFS